jgi:hypothetical protein
MTPTSALLSASGLSHRQAAAILGVSIETIRSWSCGRNPTPTQAIGTLTEMVRQNLEIAAEIAASRSPDLHGKLSTLEDTRIEMIKGLSLAMAGFALAAAEKND